MTTASCNTFASSDLSLDGAMEGIREIREVKRKWREQVKASRDTMPVCPHCNRQVQINDEGSEFTMCVTIAETLRRHPQVDTPSSVVDPVRGMLVKVVRCVPQVPSPPEAGP